MTQSVSFYFSTLLFFDRSSILRVRGYSRRPEVRYSITWGQQPICSIRLMLLNLFVSSFYQVTRFWIIRLHYLLLDHPFDLLGKRLWLKATLTRFLLAIMVCG